MPPVRAQEVGRDRGQVSVGGGRGGVAGVRCRSRQRARERLGGVAKLSEGSRSGVFRSPTRGDGTPTDGPSGLPESPAHVVAGDCAVLIEPKHGQRKCAAHGLAGPRAHEPGRARARPAGSRAPRASRPAQLARTSPSGPGYLSGPMALRERVRPQDLRDRPCDPSPSCPSHARCVPPHLGYASGSSHILPSPSGTCARRCPVSLLLSPCARPPRLSRHHARHPRVSPRHVFSLTTS